MKINRFTKKLISSLTAVSILGTAAVPAITASAASDNYAKLLQYSLYFFDANMCGKQVSSNTRLTWRSNCHTADDVDGGFHDAGDHVMFGLPQGFSASTLGWSYYEFKDAYKKLGQADHYKTISDYFSRFFRNSTKLDGSGNVVNFCYQKGNDDADHSYWGAPESQTNSRQQYWTSWGASDIAAEYAAALALSYLNFGNSEDLKYAKALYAFSVKCNQVATDGPSKAYPSSGCNDDQAWAAGWLYLATKDNYYKNECAAKQKQYLGWAHCWDNVEMGAACVYAHITGDWSSVNNYLGQVCNSGNFLFMDRWGSAKLNVSMQFSALAATKNSSADYSAWAKGQMNYILGDNPANTCFVVGYAGNSATKPHHRAASGTASAEDDSPSKHVLVGALVGGPTDAEGRYTDTRSDYVCNEVACDYNAGLVGAAAGLYTIYKTGSVDSPVAGAKANKSPQKPLKPVPSVSKCEFGDPSGDGTINAIDASYILTAYALRSTKKKTGYTTAQAKASDVNMDGTYDALDASAVLSYYAYVSTGGNKTIKQFMNK